MNEQNELTEDSDFIVDIPTFHRFSTSLDKQTLASPMIKATLNIEKLAREAGILEDYSDEYD